MTNEETRPDRALTAAQQAKADSMSANETKSIDDVILAQSTDRWRKVAIVVAKVMHCVDDKYPEMPDVFYAQRIRMLVARVRLESRGNLNYMRFSEIRLSAEENRAQKPNNI